MLRMSTTGATLAAAPLDREERMEVVRTALAARHIFCARMGHANSSGITVTYAHLSEAADAPTAVGLLAAVLGWADTEIADVAGSVAITTHHG